MERMEFIKHFYVTSPVLDMGRIDKVIAGCLDRCHYRFPQYERGHMNIMTMMEEAAELTEALSQRMRGRTDDNYDILEEMADVIMSIWCVAQIYGISHDEIKRAINVKVRREEKRIEEAKL